jgi:hypothetical protein
MVVLVAGMILTVVGGAAVVAVVAVVVVVAPWGRVRFGQDHHGRGGYHHCCHCCRHGCGVVAVVAIGGQSEEMGEGTGSTSETGLFIENKPTVLCVTRSSVTSPSQLS